MSMLTIKHVEASGYESIRQAHSVSYKPKGYAPGGDTPTGNAKLEVFGCTGDGGPVSDGWCCYADGKVYVMNDAGSTVGVYDLG